MALSLPHATWLTFRHTYSSWSHDKGVPAKVVVQLMEHANVDTTLNVYTQVLDGSLRELNTADTFQLLTTCPVTSHIPIFRLSPGRRVPRRVLAAALGQLA